MKNFKFDILLDDSMAGQIDLAVERVFSELHISEAFFANILNVTHHVMGFARNYQFGDTVYVSVSSDYQFVNFNLGGLKSKLILDLQNSLLNGEKLNEFKKVVFLIESLTDGFSFSENSFEYVFNIQALSPEVYGQRKYALKNYFKRVKSTDKIDIND